MSRKVKIMGIVNLTDDSFYSPSRARSEETLTALVKRHIDEGSDIIDFGACSTRPGSSPVTPEKEWARLKEGLAVFRRLYPSFPFSVDTFRADVAEKCYDSFGPYMINDISAGEDDPAMLPLAGRLGLEYVAMHKRGTPETMQQFCQYEDLISDIITYFRQFSERAGEYGVRNWILDPGFGFSKTVDQNYELMDHLEEFRIFSRPILVGISRKSFIYKRLGITPEEALPATTALHRTAVSKGADILRVHDTGAAVNAL